MLYNIDMGNKSIYISDADLPLYHRAQQLAGNNLSAVITQALRRYVEMREMSEQGFSEVVVNVGPPGTQLRKRFFGIRLTRWEYPTPEGYLRRFSVYRTPRESLVLHTHLVPGPGTPTPIPVDDAVSRIDVLNNIEELQDKIPHELYLVVRNAMSEPVIEDLDI